MCKNSASLRHTRFFSLQELGVIIMDYQYIYVYIHVHKKNTVKNDSYNPIKTIKSTIINLGSENYEII